MSREAHPTDTSDVAAGSPSATPVGGKVPDIYPDDIAFAQHATIGQAVADLVVQRGAYDARKGRILSLTAPVVFIQALRTTMGEVFFHDVVQLAQRDTRHHMRSQDVIGFGNETPSLAHFGDLGQALQRYGHTCRP